MPALLIGLIVLLAGSGSVVALADSARPGDALFGVDLATERVELALAPQSQKQALIQKFAEERIKEAESFNIQPAIEVDQKIDLKGKNITKIEVEVFTNETVVKIEASGEQHGFVTNLKDQKDIESLIATTYNLDQSLVKTTLVLKTENRTSIANDKSFIPVASTSPRLNEKEKTDFEKGVQQALNQIDTNANTNTDTSSVQLKTKLKSFLSAPGDDENETEEDGSIDDGEDDSGQIENNKIKTNTNIQINTNRGHSDSEGVDEEDD